MGPILDLERLGGDSRQGNTTRCWPRSIETKIIISETEVTERKRKRERQQDGWKRCRLTQGAQQAPLQSALSTPTLDCRWRSPCSSGDVFYHSGYDVQHRSHHSSAEALSRPCPDAIRVEDGSGKTEAQTSRQVTRDLHTATSQLGRAKKSLAEAKEARGQHRKAWFAFLVECANTWREQQKAYADHEQVLKSQEEKARLEIVTTTNQIQQLTSKNVTDSGLEVVNTSTPPALPPETAEAMEEDLEEKQLRLSARMHSQHVWNGQRRERGHCGRLRGGRRSCGEASTIRGASQNRPRIIATLWWCTHYLVSQGSAGRCLMNHLRVPKQVCFESEVEAYHSYRECGAACRHFDIATLKSVDPTQQWLHSVCREHNYSNPYAAVLRAIEARFQVCFPDLDSMKPQSHDDEPYSPTQLRTHG